MSGSSCIVRVRVDGEIRRDGCRYWSAEMIGLAGQLVSITRRDPDGMWIEVLDRIGNKVRADLFEGADFLDPEAARDAARFQAEQRRKFGTGIKAERILGALASCKIADYPSGEREPDGRADDQINRSMPGGADNRFRFRVLEDEVAQAVEQRASIVRRQAEFLIQLIDQRSKRTLILQNSFGPRRIAQALRDLFHFIDRRRPSLRQEGQHRPLEVENEPIVDLDLAIALFELAYAGFESGDTGFIFGHDASSNNSDGQEPNPASDGAHRLSGDGE